MYVGFERNETIMLDRASEVCEFEIYTTRNDYTKFGIHAPSYQGRKKWLSIKKDGFNSTSMTVKSRWNLIIHEFGFINPPQISFKLMFSNRGSQSDQ